VGGWKFTCATRKKEETHAEEIEEVQTKVLEEIE